MLHKKIWNSLILCLILLTSCSNNKQEESSNRELLLYTSVYPIQYVTSEIVKDIATVKSIYPPGVDAHTYEPTTKEVTSFAKGDAFIFIGGGMESFAETAAKALQSQRVQLIELSSHKDLFLTTDHNEMTDHAHSDFDPHIWLDPLRMIEIAEIIKNELIELSPKNKDKF